MSKERDVAGGCQGRGSSPFVQEHHGKDDWVRGIRYENSTPEEWLANSRAEHLASDLKPEVWALIVKVEGT